LRFTDPRITGIFNKDCPLLIIPDSNQVIHTTSYRHSSDVKKSLSDQGKRYIECKSWRSLQKVIDKSIEDGDEQLINTICNYLEITCLRY